MRLFMLYFMKSYDREYNFAVGNNLPRGSTRIAHEALILTGPDLSIPLSEPTET